MTLRAAREGEGDRPWPEECLEAERRFGHPKARLYPLVGLQGGVSTPRGQGTLVSTVGRPGGEDCVRVLLTRGGKMINDGKGKRTRGTVEIPADKVAPYGRGAPLPPGRAEEYDAGSEQRGKEGEA